MLGTRNDDYNIVTTVVVEILSCVGGGDDGDNDNDNENDDGDNENEKW